MTRKKKKPFESINFNLKEIFPITKSQEKVFSSNKNLVLHGCAGTGKTFISLYLGCCAISDNDKDKIVLIRSAVPTRDMGFLPGSEQEKTRVYEEPYHNICAELFNRNDAYKNLKDKNMLEFMTTSYIRGLTLDHSVIIVDECQNMSFHELDSIITRVGENCRIIFCGDFLQSDLKDRKGLKDFLNVVRLMKEFDYIEFGIDDIVRSEFVKNYIVTKYSLV